MQKPWPHGSGSELLQQQIKTINYRHTYAILSFVFIALLEPYRIRLRKSVSTLPWIGSNGFAMRNKPSKTQNITLSMLCSWREKTWSRVWCKHGKIFWELTQSGLSALSFPAYSHKYNKAAKQHHWFLETLSGLKLVLLNKNVWLEWYFYSTESCFENHTLSTIYYSHLYKIPKVFRLNAGDQHAEGYVVNPNVLELTHLQKKTLLKHYLQLVI